jgi:S1-C subfamily serine protease
MVSPASTKKKITLSYELFAALLLGTLVIGALSGGLVGGLILSLLRSPSAAAGQASSLPSRAWIGMTYMPITTQVAASAGISVTTGALVVTVTPNSPADRAGLQSHDIVTAIDQHTVDETTTLATLMANKKIGDHVQLTVLRDNTSQTIDVVLGRLPRNIMAPDDHGFLEQLRSALAHIVGGH